MVGKGRGCTGEVAGRRTRERQIEPAKEARAQLERCDIVLPSSVVANAQRGHQERCGLRSTAATGCKKADRIEVEPRVFYHRYRARSGQPDLRGVAGKGGVAERAVEGRVPSF